MTHGWTEINEPLLEVDGFIQAILDKVYILDILDKWGIEYSVCRSGEFSHRAKCPLPLHAFGEERTASFFISEDQNKFYCFGCNSGGTIIDLVKLYAGKPFYEAAKLLAVEAGLTSDNLEEAMENVVIKERRDPEEKVATHVYRTGLVIREFLKKIKGKREYSDWCKWADKRFAKLDKYLEMDDDEWKIAKEYHDKVISYLEGKLL